MASASKLPPPQSSNGVITGGGNRKKQKRRNKQAAKNVPQSAHPVPNAGSIYGDDDEVGYDEEYDYSDAEQEGSHHGANGYSHPPPPASKKRNKKKVTYNPDMLPPLPAAPPTGPQRALSTTQKKDIQQAGNIWNVNSQQERENIKSFWLSLSEDERKSLLKIEKEAVLRKMKQQQKHSCSCTVCGRKRTAIEEELEVLYEGYYEELEQYAHHDNPPLPSTDGTLPDPLQHRPHPFAALPPPPPHHAHHHHHHHHHHHPHSHHRESQVHEHLDEEEYSDEEEEYSDEDEEYTDDEPEPPRGIPDFFNFGQNLTVKGILTPWLEKLQIGLKGKTDNLLTVADDLLKNDGRKFIEMMEQLAERRMQRESEAGYAAANPSHPGAYPPNDHAYNSEDHLGGEEYDDDEGSYDSGEEYDDEMEDEDDMGGLTEEQRMQEGKRMFQIFAARMFEQRVLQAYREKVANERQQQLLAELEDEDKLKAQREAKKERDAQKKKEKKKQQQQAKAEEKARKEAEKAAEEARIREAEEKKQEEARRRKEEQKKKREEEKKREQEERTRKEEERLRRVREEQQKREEAERKAREAKAAEKAKKDEARKREKEEREAREKEAREKKVQEEKERLEKETGASKARTIPQIQKRPSQLGAIAVPGLPTKQPHVAAPSPRLTVATPAVPKAPSPGKQRQASQQGSHISSPKQASLPLANARSKSSSPGNAAAQQPIAVAPKTILQKPSNQQANLQQAQPRIPSPANQQPLQAPPGMPQPPQHSGFGLPPMGFPGFPGPPGTMMHGNPGQRHPMQMYPPQGPPIGQPSRMSFGGSPNPMPTPPPGMMGQHGRGMGFGFDAPGQAPPGFGQPISNPGSVLGQSPHLPEAPRQPISHSRQQSAGEKERFDPAIGRPAPIQRPTNGRPNSGEVDDLSKHLGSSALLADDDEPLPTGLGDIRRQSNPVLRTGPSGPLGFPTGGFGIPPAQSWNASNAPFGAGPGLGQQSWGSLPGAGIPGIGGWPQQNNSFGSGAGFGPGPIRASVAGHNRPLAIRLAVCHACRQLNDNAGGEAYHDIGTLLRRIEINRPMLDSAPSLRELEDICETEGDSQNGGGELDAKKNDDGILVAVRFVPDIRSTPDQSRSFAGLGEIGSPLPGKTSPVGFGAPGISRGGGPFPNLGAVGAPSSSNI